MRILLFLFFASVFATNLKAQIGVLKRVMVSHTNGIPSYQPTNSTGSEVAVNVLDGSFWTWNRTQKLWTGIDLNRVDISKGQTLSYNGNGFFAPSSTFFEPYTAITDSIGNDTLLVTAGDVLFAPGANQSTHSIALPAAPEDGQVFTITFLNSVTALTLGGNGKTVIGATTTAAAGVRIRYKYYGGTINRYVKQ